MLSAPNQEPSRVDVNEQSIAQPLHLRNPVRSSQQVPLASDPSIALSGEADEPYVSICKLALDPRGFAEVSLLKGLAFGAAAAGVAVVAFQIAKLVLFVLGRVVRRGLDALRRGLEVLWDRRPPRLGGWSG